MDSLRSGNHRGHKSRRVQQTNDSAPADPQSPPCGQPQGLEQIMTQLGELREYSAYYVRAQIDRAKLSLRRMAFYAVLAVLGVFAAFAIIFATVWLLLLGTAQGLGSVLGGRIWLGNIITALVTGVSVCAVGWFIVRRQKKRSYTESLRRYSERRREQKARFGRTVHDQATRHA